MICATNYIGLNFFAIFEVLASNFKDFRCIFYNLDIQLAAGPERQRVGTRADHTLGQNVLFSMIMNKLHIFVISLG